MRTTKNKPAEILKVAIAPVTMALLVLTVLPHHHFGWTDVEIMAAALSLTAIIFFVVSYLWKQVRA